jgi:uncharacterized protein (DUF849 family)
VHRKTVLKTTCAYQRDEIIAPVRGPLFVQSVFGLIGGIGGYAEDLMHMRRTADRLLGDDYQWSILGAGRNQMSLATIVAAMGSPAQVGLGDSLWIGTGQLAASNAEQVTRIRTFWRHWTSRSPRPTRPARCSTSKGPTKSDSERRVAAKMRCNSSSRGDSLWLYVEFCRFDINVG